MSNERERLAREWAESKLAMPAGHLDADVIAVAEHILATTTEPTTADVEWDDKKHYLAGAIDAEGHEVVMIDAERESIRVCDVDEVNEEFAPVLENPGNLTPNGKRYELREVGAPEHPETLTTVEDYENAPEGTIAVISDGLGYPIMKHFGKWWRNGIAFSSDDISEDTREVLRWGWDA